MKSPSFWSWVKPYGWPLLILLLAAVLRFHDLTTVPPGLTHDEADHGLTAWQIAAEGLRGIYFTIGYGREPLYDYMVASMMSFLGPSILAGRLVSAFASLILIAAMMAWVNQAFNRSTALMTGAGLALGFWPVMSGRQALRSVLLPMLFVLAILLFWLAIKNVLGSGAQKATPFWWSFYQLLPFMGAGIFLGLAFYSYIPARALWIIFPALLLYWFFKKREYVSMLWWRIGLMLLLMLILAAPLLIYLQTNPGAEARIAQLAHPLYTAKEGNWGPLIGQARDSLRIFFIEGDPAWRYNVAGRPLLNPIFGILFTLGLLQALRWSIINKESARNLRGSASFLSLSWLVVGFAPVLITGPELSMTQAIAIQPLLFLMPAVALTSGGTWIASLRDGTMLHYLYNGGVFLLFAALAFTTWRDYFQTWANHPQVRVQYETTLATAIDYLNDNVRGEVAVSTITPGRYHSPALAQMMLKNENVITRWFDGRGGLLLPRANSATMVVPGFTPLPPALDQYIDTAELVEILPLRESDLDRPVKIYQLDRQAMLNDWLDQLTPVDAGFGDSVKLVGFDLQPKEAGADQQVNVVTMWQAQKPLEEAVIFTHLVGPSGPPLAQSDQLNVPSYSWAPGDKFLQLHQFTLPDDIDPGEYQIAIGVYTLPEGRRLPLTGDAAGVNLLPLTSITVAP
jgi:hypothetical protein